MKVLLVDDDPDLVILASWALEKLGGFEVVASEGGAEVLDLVRQERPDVVLMDFLMPELDGDELVKRLRAEPDLEATPVIFLTGKEKEVERQALMALGARGVIVKPFEPAELPGKVERLLGALTPQPPSPGRGGDP